MFIIILILLFIWFAAVVSIVANLNAYADKLPFWHQIAVYAIILFGAPFMLIVQALEILLDCFFPGGWQDDGEE